VPIIPGTPLFPSSVFRILWIAYLPPAHTVGLPLPVGIHSERAPDGGLLFTVTEEPFNPNNPEHLHGARIVAETMIAQAG
jgi:Immunity protein 52